MSWRVEFLNAAVQAELETQPKDLRARFLRIVDLIEELGLERVREPYVKHLHGPIWEMRMKGRNHIAHVTSPPRGDGPWSSGYSRRRPKGRLGARSSWLCAEPRR